MLAPSGSIAIQLTIEAFDLAADGRVMVGKAAPGGQCGHGSGISEQVLADVAGQSQRPLSIAVNGSQARVVLSVGAALVQNFGFSFAANWLPTADDDGGYPSTLPPDCPSQAVLDGGQGDVEFTPCGAGYRQPLSCSWLLVAPVVPQKLVPAARCDNETCPGELEVLRDCGCECKALPRKTSDLIAAEMPACGSADDLKCPGVLSPELKALADSVSAVTAAVVAGSVGGAVGGSVAGAVAGSTAPTPGASVYQLVGAAQFMGVFGNMLDTRGPPPSDSVLAARRRRSQARRLLQAEGGGDAEEEEEGSKSDASGFSEAFGWANMRFDSLFTLREDSCAASHLQGFWGVAGTWLSALGGSFLLRSLLDLVTRKMVALMTGDWPADALPGFEFGDYEVHMLKTAHLGLCQACGTLFAGARCSYCPCGWAKEAMMAMAVLWLLAVPLGLIVFVLGRITAAKQRGDIHFERPEGGGSWRHFLYQIKVAEPLVEDFAHPGTMHALHSITVAGAGTLLFLLGVKEAAGGGDKAVYISFLLFGVGLNLLAGSLLTPWGRKYMVFVTNVWARSVGIRYEMQRDGSVKKEECEVGCSCLAPLVRLGAWVVCKVLTICDPDHQGLLRCRGEYKKVDKFKIFYGDYNHRGLYFGIFLLAKNLFMGLLLTSEPCVLVSPLSKVWVVALVFVAEFIIHWLYSPEMDLFNGYKIAVQMLQQAVIMFTAALTVSGALSLDQGAAIAIQMSVVQVALAMPEQIWGIVCNFVIGKYDRRDPQFKMTAKELKAQRELNVGMMGKIEKARGVVDDFRAMVPLMKKGDVKGVMGAIVGNPRLLVGVNTLQPGTVAPVLKKLFASAPVKKGLETVGKTMPVVKTPCEALARAEWDTQVGFREGVLALAGIKNCLQAAVDCLLGLKDSNFTAAMGKILGSPDLVHALEQLTPGMLMPALKTLFTNGALKRACDEVKHHFKDDMLAARLEELTSLAYETPADLEEFAHVSRELMEFKPKVPKGQKKKDVRQFVFPDDLLTHFDKFDAIDILKTFALPEPVGPLFQKGIDAALKAQVLFLSKDCVADLKRGDFVSGVGKLLCTPDLVIGIDKVKPGLLSAPLRRLLALPALRDAVDKAKPSIPHPELRELLDGLLRIDFDAQDAVVQFGKQAKSIVEFKPPEHHGLLHNAVHGIKDGIHHLGEGMHNLVHKSHKSLHSDKDKSFKDNKSSGHASPAPASSRDVGGASEHHESESGGEEHPHHHHHGFFSGLKEGMHNMLHHHSHSEHAKAAAAHGHFEFPRSLLEKLDRNDAIDLLKSVQLPSPVGSIMAKAIDGVLAAEMMAQAQGMLEALGEKKLDKAATNLVASPDLLLNIERLRPGMLLKPLAQLFRQDFVADAVAKLKDTCRDERAVSKVERVCSLRFETAEELSEFCAASKDLAHTPALPPFPACVLGDMDFASAVEMLRGLKLPSPMGPALNKALDAAVHAHLLASASPLLDALKAKDVKAALAALLATPPLMAAVEKLKPGGVLPVLRQLFREQPLLTDAIARAHAQIPDPKLKRHLDALAAIPFTEERDIAALARCSKQLAAYRPPPLPTAADVVATATAAASDAAKDALPDAAKDALPDVTKDALPDAASDALPDVAKNAAATAAAEAARGDFSFPGSLLDALTPAAIAGMLAQLDMPAPLDAAWELALEQAVGAQAAKKRSLLPSASGLMGALGGEISLEEVDVEDMEAEEVLSMLMDKMDLSSMMETLEDFVAKLPDTIQTVAGPAMKLLALKSQVDKARKDLVVSIGAASKPKMRRGSVSGNLEVSTPTAKRGSAASATAAVGGDVEMSGGARALAERTASAGPLEISSATIAHSDSLHLSTAPGHVRLEMPGAPAAVAAGPADPDAEAAHMRSVPLSPTTPGGLISPTSTAPDTPAMDAYRRSSTALLLSPTPSSVETPDDDEPPTTRVVGGQTIIDFDDEEEEEEEEEEGPDVRRSMADKVKAWPAEIWMGICFGVCALVTFFILAAMTNSADCGCACAAR